MEHDELILSQISENANISQRQLAEKTNLSLGHLNLILHRMVEKGLVKIERVNARNLRYILTPQGIARNTKRTYLFLRSAFQHILKVQKAFLEITNNNENLYIIPEHDEIYEIVRNAIKENRITNVKQVADLDILPDTAIVIVWTLEAEARCQEMNIKTINLLGRISLGEIV